MLSVLSVLTVLTVLTMLTKGTEGTIGKFSQCKIGGLAFILSQSFRVANEPRSTPKSCLNNLTVDSFHRHATRNRTAHTPHMNPR